MVIYSPCIFHTHRAVAMRVQELGDKRQNYTSEIGFKSENGTAMAIRILLIDRYFDFPSMFSTLTSAKYVVLDLLFNL